MHATLKKRYLDLNGIQNEVVLVGATESELVPGVKLESERNFDTTVLKVYKALQDQGSILDLTGTIYTTTSGHVVDKTVLKNYSLPLKPRSINLFVFEPSVNSNKSISLKLFIL